MKGSAIVTLTQSSTGQWSLQDRFATGFTRPAVTNSSGAVLHSVQATGNVLRAAFSRPLESCSAPSVRINLGQRNQVVWAFGAAGTRQFSYHGPDHRGYTSELSNDKPAAAGRARAHNLRLVAGGLSSPPRLLRPVSCTAAIVFREDASAAAVPTSAMSSEAASEPGETTFDVRMPPTAIRMVDDQYDCIDVELPQDAPRHITRWEGLLEGAPANVHHMVIFACAGKPSTFGRGAYSCPGMPMECMEFVTVRRGSGWVGLALQGMLANGMSSRSPTSCVCSPCVTGPH